MNQKTALLLSAPDFWISSMAVANLFDPQNYKDVRLPLLEAKTLPPACYTSEEFYQREVDRIFMREWNFVGRVDEIPQPGDYLVFDICGESAIVMRGNDGQVRAFANTCRHRGTRLLNDRGHCRMVICPYHSWAYALDGSLYGLKGMEQVKGFEKSENGLIPIRLETWAGFMFVTFSADAACLIEYLGNLSEEFASYNFSDYVCVRRKEYDLECNWKIYVENALEDYHTPTVHKTSIGLQETDRVDANGNWDSIHMQSEVTSAVLAEDGTPFPHAPNLTGRAACGTFFTIVYPATFFASTQDCMWWLQCLPSGPSRTKVVHGSCFPRGTTLREDFDQHVSSYYKRWDKSIPEDNAISERQQAGLGSAFCQPGRLSHLEPIVHAIGNWVLDRTLD